MFSGTNTVCISYFLMRAASTTNMKLLDTFALLILGDEHKL